MSRPQRKRTCLVLLFLGALATLCVCPWIGMQRLGLADVMGSAANSAAHTIFWQIRVPRVMAGFLAGAGLAVCGMAFQAMFRNPLATPFTLGVASGASLGAAIAVRCGLTFVFLGIHGISLAAFGGALGSICLVYGLTRLRQGSSTTTMLLAGVAVSLFFSSLILALQYLSDFTQSFRIVRWLMGGVEVMGYESVLSLIPLTGIGVLVLFAYTHELNLLSTGDDLAMSRGVDVRRTKRGLFLASSLTVGGVVAVCGPIGFVGMMVPHICRLLVGPDHRFLLPATFLFGGAFLTLCDTLARTIIAPAEIPVGVITSLLGGPFFLWLLIRGTGQRHR